MKIVGNESLLLRLKNPARVIETITDSKLLPDNNVLVKWGLEEAHTLKQIGIKVPSPIEKNYDWPGQFKPYDHQKETSAFLTMHRKAFCFSEQGCVDSETEYLSPVGWRKLSEYEGGKVAQFHPETGEAEFVDPIEYVKLPCSEMIEFKSKYGIDQLLSPEHRVLHYKADRNRSDSNLFWRVDSAEKLYCQLQDKEISDVYFKTTYTPQDGKGIPLTEAQLRLQIAVIADGYFGSDTSWCVVRLKKGRKIERMRLLLDQASVKYAETTPEYAGAEGFHIFKFYAPVRTKVFGPKFWQATAEQLRIVTEEVPHWDGSFRKSDGVAFYSTEKQSADFVQHAFVSQGKVARITDDGRGCWQVYVRSNARLVGISNRHSKPNTRIVPSTDGFKYCFMVPSTFLVFRRNGCVFVSGNTGKTSSAIWAADYLMKQGVIKRALIVCPLSIMHSAWKNDLFSLVMHRSVDIAYGNAEKRKKIINGNAEFVIINYDGIGIVKGEIEKGGFDLFIIDEASAYKNAMTKRWKTMNWLVKPDTWLWMMTGTPAAQSPVDAYGLAKLVNPNAVPRYMTTFKDQVMLKVGQFRWIPKPDATETVHRVLQPAIRFTKDECLDLPEMTYVKRDVALTAQQTKYYKELKKKIIMEAAGEEITAANAAVMMGKLLQIASGSVYTDSGSVLEFDITNRYKVLLEVMEETTQKVLVFVPFKNSIRMLAERLTKDGITNEVISGDVSAGKRADIFAAFQGKPDPRVLIIQPQSAAHGVTLTAANTVVWWGPTSSLETYAQANARVHRPGQTHKCTVVQLQGAPIERHVYSLLDNKIDIHSKIIDLYKEMLD